MKTCRDCHETKPDSEFGIRQPICKPCRSIVMAQRYLNNKINIDKKNKVWYQEKGKADRQADPEKYKFERRLRKYGITKDQYFQKLEDQGHVCPICTRPFTDTPHIDHCHKTKEFRGLLHTECNTGIGLLKEDPAIFNNCITYVQKYKK